MLLALFLTQIALVVVQVVALLFGGRGKRGGWWAAAALVVPLGLVHILYERTVEPEANIRVDLLVLYPLLVLGAILSTVALVRVLVNRRSD